MRDYAVSEDDKATEQEMWATELAIKSVRDRREEIKPTGLCYNCEERIAPPKKFCDCDCAEDYEKGKRR